MEIEKKKETERERGELKRDEESEKDTEERRQRKNTETKRRKKKRQRKQKTTGKDRDRAKEETEKYRDYNEPRAGDFVWDGSDFSHFCKISILIKTILKVFGSGSAWVCTMRDLSMDLEHGVKKTHRNKPVSKLMTELEK